MAFQLPMPCKNVSDCFPCNDLPTINHSAEGQDTIQDFTIQWGNIQTNTPPLGRLFRANGCTTLCLSSVSQEEAFLCAQRAQAACVMDNWHPQPPDDPVCLNFPCAPTVPPTDPPVVPFGNQPEGCTTFCADGAPFTFSVPAGSFIADNQTLANRMASSFACREALLHKTCLNIVSDFGCLDAESTFSFVATGPTVNTDQNFWEIRSGSLPPGFTFTSTVTGSFLAITGTPTALGDFTFTMRVTAPNGDFAERPFTVTVVGITTPNPLPDAQLGVAYSQTLAQSGITGIILWMITEGVLPTGLTLNMDTGEISGTATQSGDFVFTVNVSSGTRGCDKIFNLKVAGCFIDPSPNLDLSSFGQQVLARNGGIAVWTDSVTFEGWYYLNHVFQKTPFVGQSQNFVCAAGRYIGAQDLVGPNNIWIDLQLGVIRNLAHTTVAPLCMNDNGDMALQGGFDSFIYNAASNTFSANIGVADGFSIQQINNSRAAVGLVTVGIFPNADIHAFFRSAAGVYTDLHPGGVHPTTSFPGGQNAQFGPEINSAGHMAGYWDNGAGSVAAFANFGVGSIFLSGLLAGIGRVIINDSDLVAYDNSSTGHVFIYNGGATTDIGNQGVLKGFNNAGIVVGNTFANNNAWIYANGVVSNLISKIPTAAANGWTSLLTVDDISNDNFVTGFGIQNGVVTIYAAKVCI